MDGVIPCTLRAKKNGKIKLSNSTCTYVVCATKEKERWMHHNKREHTEKIEVCAWEIIKMLALLLLNLVTTGAFFDKSE